MAEEVTRTPKDNLYNKVVGTVNNIIPGKALDIPLDYNTEVKSYVYDIKDSEGNVVDTLSELPETYVEGRKIYRDEDGGWTYNPKASVSLNRETGEITVSAPDFVLDRPTFKDQIEGTLQTLSRNYRNNNDVTYTMADGSIKNTEEVIDSINDPNNDQGINQYVKAVQGMMKIENGFYNDDGEWIDGDRKRYDISDDITLDDNYFMLRQSVALGDDVKDTTRQAVPKQLAQAAFIRAIDSYDEETGTVEFKDLMDNAWNRSVTSDDKLEALDAALDEYFANSDFEDTDELARCIALSEFINGKDPNVKFLKGAAYTVGSFAEGALMYGADLAGTFVVGPAAYALGGAEWVSDKLSELTGVQSYSTEHNQMLDFYHEMMGYLDETQESRQKDRQLLSDTASAAYELGYGAASLITLIAVGNAFEGGIKTLLGTAAMKSTAAAAAATEGGARITLVTQALASGSKTIVNITEPTKLAKFYNVISHVMSSKAMTYGMGLAFETVGEALAGNPDKFYRVMNSGALTEEAKDQLWEDFIGNSIGLVVGVGIGKGIAKVGETRMGRVASANIARSVNKITGTLGEKSLKFKAKLHGVDDLDAYIRKLSEGGKLKKADVVTAKHLINLARETVGENDVIKVLGKNKDEIIEQLNVAEKNINKLRSLENAIDEMGRQGMGIVSKWYNSGEFLDFQNAAKAMENSYETLYKLEKVTGNLSGDIAKKAGKLAITQAASDYVNASIRLDIDTNMLEIAEKAGDAAKVKALNDEMGALRAMISKYQDGASADVLDAANDLISKTKLFYKNANDVLVSEGVLSKSRIMELRESGNWGENGELYAHFIRNKDTAKALRPQRVSVISKDTVADVESYVLGADDGFMDPLATTRAYMRAKGDVKARQDVVKRFNAATNGKFSKELMTTAQTEAGQLAMRLKPEKSINEVKSVIKEASKDIRGSGVVASFVYQDAEEHLVMSNYARKVASENSIENLKNTPIDKFKATSGKYAEYSMAINNNDLSTVWEKNRAAAGKEGQGVFDYILENWDDTPQAVKAYIKENFELSNMLRGEQILLEGAEDYESYEAFRKAARKASMTLDGDVIDDPIMRIEDLRDSAKINKVDFRKRAVWDEIRGQYLSDPDELSDIARATTGNMYNADTGELMREPFVARKARWAREARRNASRGIIPEADLSEYMQGKNLVVNPTSTSLVNEGISDIEVSNRSQDMLRSAGVTQVPDYEMPIDKEGLAQRYTDMISSENAIKSGELTVDMSEENFAQWLGDIRRNGEGFQFVSSVNEDFENTLQRLVVGNSKEFKNTADVTEGVQTMIKNDKLNAKYVRLAKYNDELNEVAKSVGATTEQVDSIIQDGVEKMIDSVAQRPVTNAYFKTLTDYYGLDDETARRYFALSLLADEKQVTRNALRKQFEAELKEQAWEGDLKGKDYLVNRLSNQYTDRIIDEFNDMRVTMQDMAPTLVDQNKLYDEVEELKTKINKLERDTDNVVAIQDNEGKVSFLQVDPLLASFMNHDSMSIPMTRREKINYLLSKTFRLGTTSINIKSMMNQTFRDGINAFVGGDVYRDWSRCVSDMNDVLGDNVVDWIRQSDEVLADNITKIAAETGKTESDVAYSIIKGTGSAISPTMTETAVYKRAADVSSSIKAGKQAKGVADLTDTSYDGVMKAINAIEDKLGAPNNFREVSLRNAVFRNGFADAVKRGYSYADAKDYATFLMNNATTNFGRTTEMFSNMQRTVPFLGAAINGTKSFYRLLSVDPVGVMGRLIGGVVLPTVYLTASSMESDEDRELYKQVREYQKDSAMVFVRNGQVFSVPLPQEFTAMVSIPRSMVESMYKANRHSFWQLAVNDVVGISPIDLKGFVNIDSNMLSDGTSKDGFFVNNVEPGLARLFSQLAPVPEKALMMGLTGIDPYTMKKIDTSYNVIDLDTGESVPMSDYSNKASKALAKFVREHTSFELSAPMAEKMLSTIFGQAPVDYVGWLAELSDAVVSEETTATDAFDAIAKNIGESVSDPLHISIYRTEAESAWKATVNEFYQRKEELMMSDEWQSYMTKRRNATSSEELEKLGAVRDNLVKSYYDDLKISIENLQTKYGAAFTAEKYASVISLSVLDQVGADSTIVGQQALSELYDDSKSMAVDTMYRLGFQSPSDYSAFGYLKTNSDGSVSANYTTPMAILNMKNSIYRSGKYDEVNISSILGSAGLDTRSEAYKAMMSQVDALYAAENPDYDAINAIYKKWDTKVMVALYPYISRRGIEATLNDANVVDLLDNVIKVPSDFAKTKQGRYFSSPGLNKQRGYAKSYIEYVYNKLEGNE